MEQSGDTPQTLLHKRLAFAILEYFSEIVQNKEPIPGVETDSIEVALQCVATAFGLDLRDEAQKQQFSIQPLSLPQVFGLGLAGEQRIAEAIANSQARMTAPSSTTTTTQTQPPSPQLSPALPPAQPKPIPAELQVKFTAFINMLHQQHYFQGCEPGQPEYEQRLNTAKAKFLQKYGDTLDDKKKEAEAETLKNQGNEKLANGDVKEAVELYCQAIALNPKSAVYYGNRAAAYSRLGEHERAILDCKSAIELDPKYTKAYSRLGFSLFSLGRYKEAVQLGYQQTLRLDPDNQTAKEALALAESKLEEEEAKTKLAQTPPQTTPPQTSTPPTPGPPFAGLEQFMGNPEIQRMAQQINTGQGAPNLSEMLSNPDLMNMAQQLMGSPGFAQMLNNPAFMNMAQGIMQNPQAMNELFRDYSPDKQE